MFIDCANRNLTITFLSIFAFVVMILIATMIPGLNGVQTASGVSLPLANPLIVLSCLVVGALAGKYRSSILFLLPISYCIGLVAGVVVQIQSEFSMMLTFMLLITFVLWLVSSWLLAGSNRAGICILFMLLAAVFGAFQPMPSEVYGSLIYTLIGMLLSISLLVAMGVCVVIALLDVDSIFPDKNFPRVSKFA